jgi:hypothetical protein
MLSRRFYIASFIVALATIFLGAALSLYAVWFPPKNFAFLTRLFFILAAILAGSVLAMAIASLTKVDPDAHRHKSFRFTKSGRADHEKTNNQAHLELLLFVSFVISVSGYIIDQTVRWSDHVRGAFNGLIHVFLTGFVWLLFVLPLSLLIYGLFRWRGWQRFRSPAILLPAIVFFVLGVANLFTNPPTAANRLQRLAHVELPPTGRDIRTHFTGGGMADHGDTYYFRCSPDDTERLIRALKLQPTSHDFEQSHFDRAPFPSWPDPSTWAGSTLYRGNREDGPWFFYLRTDAAREQVYLFVGCF